eukprot:TRINITY_DN7266_c0_g1_i1.p1 TRINITY_DN7266_c0_g1~~TRINITY_DN7266_c0_g1_i1.p1  ORF type:complete len:464 (-),score=73.40 TRINITY_DN7266_c0_g1_i1:14-1405(-)
MQQQQHTTLLTDRYSDGTLTAVDVSTLVSLLDRFELHRPWQNLGISDSDSGESSSCPSSHHPVQSRVDGDSGMVACWDMGQQAKRLEHAFLRESHERIERILRAINLRLSFNGGHTTRHLHVVTHDSVPLTFAQTDELLALAVRLIEVKDTFDYVSFVERTVAAGIELIAELRPYFKEQALLVDGIAPIAIEPAEEGSGMAPYEVNFQAAGSSLLLYPNANKFTHEHKATWTQTAARPGRVFRDYYFACAYAALHELVHCIQTATMGPTSATNIWKKEYGACYLQMNFMGAVAKQRPDIFPPGLVSEIILWYNEIVHRLHAIVGADTHAAFARWRDSRGVTDPVSRDAAHFLSENRIHGYYLKARLAVEAFVDAEMFGSLCDGHFHESQRDQFPASMPLASSDMPSAFSTPVATHLLDTCPALGSWTTTTPTTPTTTHTPTHIHTYTHIHTPYLPHTFDTHLS